MRKSGFTNFAGKIGLFAGPVAEAGSEAMGGESDSGALGLRRSKESQQMLISKGLIGRFSARTPSWGDMP